MFWKRINDDDDDDDDDEPSTTPDSRRTMLNGPSGTLTLACG